jgi:ribonuclease E
MEAEADQPDDGEREQAQRGGRRHLQPLTRARRRQHEKRQHQAGGDLDTDAGDQRGGARAKARARPRRHGERKGEHQQDQGVVVRPADGEHEQHRVQAHERRRPSAGVAEAARRARDQRDRGQARQPRERLQDPEAAREPERRGGVADEREQRAVGGMLEGPSDEREHRVRAGFRGDMRVRVQPVQGAHARERQIAEHVLGDQRRPEEEDHVRQHDARRERATGQGSRREQHEQVARAHDQHQRLKPTSGERRAHTLKRSCQPAGPAADARRDVLRGARRRIGAQQEDAAEHPQQAEPGERTQDRRRRSRVGAPVRLSRAPCGGPDARYGGRGLYGHHCCV